MSNGLDTVYWQRQKHLASRVQFLERQMVWVLSMVMPAQKSPALMDRLTKMVPIIMTLGRILLWVGPWLLIGAQAAWKWALPYMGRLAGV